MDNPINDNNSGYEEESFAELFEQTIRDENFKEGDIVKGRVIQVAKDYVVVDIGFKSEGQSTTRLLV